MMRSRAVREGTVGLFALLGLIIFSGITIWLRGGGFGQRGYQITAEFFDVGGLQTGALVRFRGVTVGRIQSFEASSNLVKAHIEISSLDIRIPKDISLAINRQGLIGEASIDITPSPLASLPPEAEEIDPFSKECEEQAIIICDGDVIQGQASEQLTASLNRLAQAFSDPVFIGNLNSATENTSLAAARIAKLSDEISVVLKSTQRDLESLNRNVAVTTQSLNQTANKASRFLNNLDSTVGENRPRITQTVNETAQLVRNLNTLLIENRSRLDVTLDNINRASNNVNELASTLNATAIKVNSTLEASDTRKLIQDLEIVIANAAEASQNLRDLSTKINDPTILLTLQQTLDAARVTFENTQKITSDLDELTGDPEFRNNLRRLVNGLNDLVSSSEQLQYHLQIAQVLESASQELSKSQIPAKKSE